MTVEETFDVAGPLPGAGITVLEASAGTGKTFTITALVTRYVAQGVPLDAILAVTFTRMATGELRDRVRRRLVTAADLLARHLDAGEPVPTGDEIASLLARGDPAEIQKIRIRLEDAVASFDSATIATTHGFCQLVLDGLGSAGDVAARATLLEDPAGLVEEVTDDLYLRWALLHGEHPGFTRDDARRAAAAAIGNPGVALTPEPKDDAPGRLRRLVDRATHEVARRLQEDAYLTYDHLLSRLAQTLESEERGPLACRRLRDRYRVVLVDEFQDTDPVQWRVVQRAFGDGTTTLVLVGDPKQAIYSFRGADVHAYLDAADHATRHTLAVSWRADQNLLDATAAILSPLQMGDKRIVFRSVGAPPDRARPGTDGFPNDSPVRIRLVHEHQPGIQTTKAKGLLQKGALIEWIAGDVGRDVAALLGAGAHVADLEQPVTEEGTRPWREVESRDIAVLTRTNRQSVSIRNALRQAGVPAVIAGLDSVFTSPAAGYWLRLLEALEEPTSRSRAAALALTPWVGLTASEVAVADERTWEAVHARAHRWAADVAARGVASLYRSITTSEGLPARVVANAGGERELTDMGHVAELLHFESAAAQMGVRSMRAWLARRIEEVDIDRAGAEERSRRLDSDAEAVQVLTVHRSKGLEFGVVYCPYLWDTSPMDEIPAPVVFHDPEQGGQRTLDVGCRDRGGPAAKAYMDHRTQALEEQRGEDLRLMYVALTRARHQVVVWWGRADRCQHSPLARLLLCRDGQTGFVDQPWKSEPKDDAVRKALGRLLERAKPGLIAVELTTEPPRSGPPSDPLPSADTSGMEVARFGRTLDLRWRRSSYTSITASVHEDFGSKVGSEPEEPGLSDEPATADESPAGAPIQPSTEDGPVCLLGGIPGGTEFGTFVHGVLERVDFAAEDLSSELTAGFTAHRVPAPPAALDLDVLSAGLVASLSTPLGPLLPGASLQDITRTDRADELGFELPLVGGDTPCGLVTTAQIASLLAAYLPADGGVLAGYPAQLADPLLAANLRGYLTGSLDLVFRRGGLDGVVRWYVADYKTNRLAGPDGLTTWHYRPEALDEEMQRRHYPLQALLYLVALHRFLRWRLPGYSPATHLGGVLYLFLRGMAGTDTPIIDGHPCGVWSWAPPPSLVVALSDLFASGGGRS